MHTSFNEKRYSRLLALLIAACLIITTVMLGSVQVNASAHSEDPINENNPVIRVTYERKDYSDTNQPYDQMKIRVIKGGIQGKVDLNGRLFELNEVYTLDSENYIDDDEGFFITDDDVLYEFHQLSEETPSHGEGPAGEPATYGKYANSFELIKTDKIPEYAQTLTSKHEEYTKKTNTEYYVNGEKVTQEKYRDSKHGAYTEQTSTSFIKDSAPVLKNQVTTFLGLTSSDYQMHYSDGTSETVQFPVYNFQIDEYYVIEQTYLKKYSLTTDTSSGKITDSNEETASSVSSSEKTDSSQVNKNIPKVKNLSAKAGKKSLTLKWKKLSKKQKKNASYIQIQYSKSHDFSAAKTVKAKKTAASKKISKLKSKTTYYVRARVVYKGTTGAWSKTKKVKVK